MRRLFSIIFGKSAAQFDLLVCISYGALALLLLLFLGLYSYARFKDNLDHVQLYWQSVEDSEFLEQNSSALCAFLDDQWHTYAFPISEESNLKHLRLDPVREYRTAAQVEVRNLELVLIDVPVAQPVVMNEPVCTACRVEQTGDTFGLDELEFDPFVEFSVVPMPTSLVELVRLEMRVKPRLLGPLNWYMRWIETNSWSSACTFEDFEDY